MKIVTLTEKPEPKKELRVTVDREGLSFQVKVALVTIDLYKGPRLSHRVEARLLLRLLQSSRFDLRHDHREIEEVAVEAPVFVVAV